MAGPPVIHALFDLSDRSVDDFSGRDLGAGATCDLKADATGKFLTNHAGTPFFWLGDTAKDIRLCPTSTWTRVCPLVRLRAVNGNLPLVSSDLTKPNPLYWAHMNHIILFGEFGENHFEAVESRVGLSRYEAAQDIVGIVEIPFLRHTHMFAKRALGHLEAELRQ